MSPEVQPTGTPIMPQSLLEPKQLEGNFEYGYGTAPQVGDKRIWLWQKGGKDYKNDSPHVKPVVEESVIKKESRAFSEKADEKGEYTPHSVGDLTKFWHYLRRNKTAEDWQAMRREGQRLLTDVINQLTGVNASTMAEFSRDMNLFGRRNNAGVSLASDETFSALIRDIIDQRGDVRVKINQAIDRATKLIEEEADAILDLLQNDGDVTKLKQPALTYLRQLYENDQKVLQAGGHDRNAEQMVRSLRDGAAGGVRPGRERDVQQGQVEIAMEWEALRATSDPKEEQRHIENIRAIEARIFPYLMPLTRSKEGRTELQPVALEQASNLAHTKAKIISRNKDENGQRNSLSTFEASWFDADWDATGIMGEIMLSHWVAEAAIERLTEKSTIELDDVDKDGNPIKISHSIDGKDEFLTHFASTADIETVKERRKNTVTNLEASLKIIQQEVYELAETIEEKAAEVSTLKAGSSKEDKHYKNLAEVSKRGGKDGGKKDHELTLLQGVHTANQAKLERLRKAEAELAALRRRLMEKLALRNEIEDPDTNTGTLVEARAKINDEPTDDEKRDYEAQITSAKQSEYDTLLNKLREFIDQNEYNKPLPHFLNDRQWRLIHQLTGINLEFNKNKEAIGISLQPIWTGNVPRKDGKTIFKSGRAAINTWTAMPELKSRISGVVIEKMLEKNERFPEFVEIKKEADQGGLDPQNKKRKAILAYGYSPNPDVSGGASRPETGIDSDKLEQLKAKYKLSTNQFLDRWLDEPKLQRELGITPEEYEELQAYYMARRYLTRSKHFTAENGWFYDVMAVGSGEADNLTTQLGKLISAGKKLNSQDRGEVPFQSLNDHSNEWAYTLVKDGTAIRESGEPTTEIEVWYRERNLAREAGAPRNIVDRYAASILSRLELYNRHAKLGAPAAIDFSGKATKEQIHKIGAYFMAYTEYTQRVMEHVRRVQSGWDGKYESDAEKLEALVDIHDKFLHGLTFHIVNPKQPFDANGAVNLVTTNKALRRYVHTHITVHGKMNSDIGKIRDNFVKVEVDEKRWNDEVPDTRAANILDPHTGEWVKPPVYRTDPRTGENILDESGRPIPVTAYEFVEDQLMKAVDAYARHMTLKTMLGEQALNQIPSDTKNSDRKISERIAGFYVETIMTETLKNFEAMMDMRHGYTETGYGIAVPALWRRIKGAIDLSLPSQVLRWASGALFGGVLGGNLLLRDHNANRIGALTEDLFDKTDREKGKLEKNKFAGLVEWYLAARLSQAINTGNQRGFKGIFSPEKSSLLVSEAANKPGLQLDKVTKTLWNILVRSMMQMEDADGIDRTIASERLISQKVTKELGVNIYELYERVTKTEVPDNQYIDDRGNRHNHRSDGSRVKVHELSRGDEVRSTAEGVPRRMMRYVRECLHPRGKFWGIGKPLDKIASFLPGAAKGPWQSLHGKAAAQRQGREDAAVNDRPFVQK